KPHYMNLDNLDKALHDLDMLSAITEARREYLREGKSNYSVMRYNTRYVSNVTVGYCMKRTTNMNRICPYVLPIRNRTKSENSDAVGSDVSDGANESKVKSSFLEPSTSGYFRENTAKRCQSLENLNLSVEPAPGPEILPEMDRVSTQIQKLQVHE
ncbi:Uncharacterized protein OBRU01_11029, partial [Operophtera brumata]